MKKLQRKRKQSRQKKLKKKIVKDWHRQMKQAIRVSEFKNAV